MKEITKLYGAYGSNMNLEQMATRCPKANVIGTAILNDYKRTFRGNYKGVANIEACKGNSVPIVLWNITDDCERALDVYEGYPKLYIKKEIEVTAGKEIKKVMVYVMAEEFADAPAKPTEYYFNVIARGYTNNNLNLKPLQIAYSECLHEVKC